MPPQLAPTRTLLAVLLLAASAPVLAQADVPSDRRPVIDMHLHAGPGSATSTYYTLEEGESPDAGYLRTLLADLDANDVVAGVVGGPPVHAERFRCAAPDRLTASVILPCTDGRSANLYPCYPDGGDWPDLGWLREEVEAGRVGALGELYNVYTGVSPTDPRMAPYLALAAEHDLLVLAHAEEGPPPEGRVPGCCPHFDGSLGDPALWGPVLERHPDLRLVLYHAFRPAFVESVIALLDVYPNVMVETSPMSRVPPPLVHRALARYVEAGHADRIVFGSDYLGAIGASLAVLEASPLTEAQKQAVRYGNAARFLRLSDEEVARHHALSPVE